MTDNDEAFEASRLVVAAFVELVVAIAVERLPQAAIERQAEIACNALTIALRRLEERKIGRRPYGDVKR